jgi:DNA invertase Pin-like site-specific DNA recombinase
MMMELGNKVTAVHLKRAAYLYVRQSTLRQVVEHTESTKRQYALKQRAVQLGWRPEQVVVIDSDLGESGASTVDRDGFQKLVAEVSMGRAGIVLGLEVSRLARNSADWHRLLEICAFNDTLILDEDGIYNPGVFNDRLLLGLKGTMSEAELHVMRMRMIGGVLTKARRGELCPLLPIGFMYDDENKVVLDSDRQVQESIRLVFSLFRRTGSAYALVRHFRDKGLLFPSRPLFGPNRHELIWVPLQRSTIMRVLNNPRYAGAFFFGRTRGRRRQDGGRPISSKPVPKEQWHALIRDAHPGYIDWETYEGNLKRLEENCRAHPIHLKVPPREGPALLQGLAICGNCGRRLSVRYHWRGTKLIPDYLCQYHTVEKLEKACMSIPSTLVDAYQSKKPVAPAPPGIVHPDFLEGAFGGTAFGPSVTAIAGLLSALKAQSTTTSATFTPVDEALIADIENVAGNTTRVVSFPFPGDLKTGTAAIAAYMRDVYAARGDAARAIVAAHPPKKAGDPLYDPSTDLKDLDTQLTALQSSLAASATSTTSDVVLGAGLLASLGAISKAPDQDSPRLTATPSYRILVFSNVAAGGGTRTNQSFFISFFAPLPHPSYNGGAVVSFSLRDQDGKLIAAHTYHYVYGYSKWNAPKSSKTGYSNVP